MHPYVQDLSKSLHCRVSFRKVFKNDIYKSLKMTDVNEIYIYTSKVVKSVPFIPLNFNNGVENSEKNHNSEPKTWFEYDSYVV